MDLPAGRSLSEMTPCSRSWSFSALIFSPFAGLIPTNAPATDARCDVSGLVTVLQRALAVLDSAPEGSSHATREQRDGRPERHIEHRERDEARVRDGGAMPSRLLVQHAEPHEQQRPEDDVDDRRDAELPGAERRIPDQRRGAGHEAETAILHRKIAQAATNEPNHVSASMITMIGSVSRLEPCCEIAYHHWCIRDTSAWLRASSVGPGTMSMSWQ